MVAGATANAGPRSSGELPSFVRRPSISERPARVVLTLLHLWSFSRYLHTRCFPHCCPLHVERSYCGSPLELRLTLRTGYDDLDADRLQVFARFEPVGDVDDDDDTGAGDGRLELFPSGGSTTATSDSHPHSLAWLQRQSQSADNPTGAWIQAERSPAPASSDRCSGWSGGGDAATAAASVTFVLNGEPGARWYYHWESGANKAQRAMRHALRAYVYYRHASSDALQLVCVMQSPTFTIVSYRRAAPIVDDSGATTDEFAARNPGIDDALSASRRHAADHAVRDEEDDVRRVALRYATAPGRPVDYQLHELVKRNISRAFRDYRSGQSAPGVSAGSKRSRSTSAPASVQSDYQAHTPSQSGDSRYFRLINANLPARSSFQPDETPTGAFVSMSTVRPDRRTVMDAAGRKQSSDLTDKLMDLSVVYLFVTRPDLGDMALSSLAHMRRIQQVSTEFWGYDWGLEDILRAVCAGRPATREREEDYGCLSRGRGGYYSDIRTGGDDLSYADALHDTHLVESDGLAHLLVEISVWAFSIDNHTRLRGLLEQLSMQMRRDTSGTFLHGARAAFETCAVWCWTRLNGFLADRRGEELVRGHGQSTGRANCVRKLCNALIHEISRGGRFNSLQQSLTDISERLEGSGEPYGWRAFVAQLREAYIVRTLTIFLPERVTIMS